MDLSFSTEQSALADAVSRLYAKESHPERVRLAEASGFDNVLWQALVRMGLPTMGVAETQGGGGASLTDLAVVAEQHGASLGSAPLIETMVVARLLARGDGSSATLLDRLVQGAPAGLGLHPARDGRLRLVPGGAVAAVVVGLDGDELVVVSSTGNRELRRTLHSGAVADVDLGASA
ncbi:MAG TPA: acyl-CoA dehydrogenase family protein, partial [Acidimicrobiales bacterium]